MSVEAFKLLYQVHMLRKDEEGRVIAEPAVSVRVTPEGQQEALVLYPHQFGELPQRVAVLVAEVEARLSAEQEPETPEPEAQPPNRAQRRGAAKARPRTRRK